MSRTDSLNNYLKGMAGILRKHAAANSNMYPDAGTNAPEEVKKAIAAFRALSPQERAASPLLYVLLGSGTPEYKMSKIDAAYVSPSPYDKETCGNCEYAYKHVQSGGYICSQMAGEIKPADWCRLYEK